MAAWVLRARRRAARSTPVRSGNPGGWERRKEPSHLPYPKLCRHRPTRPAARPNGEQKGSSTTTPGRRRDTEPPDPAQLGGELVRRPRIASLAPAVRPPRSLALAAGPASAGAEAGPGQALVRVAPFSPDASYVDVYM